MAQPTRVVLVTGANRGIGLAICKRIASSYIPLIIYAASRSGILPPIQTIKPNIQILPTSLNLTDKSSINALLTRIKTEQSGGLDVLIQSAGIYYYRENITAEQREETLDVNYRAALLMCQSAIPLMRPGSRIVNLSSQAGQLRFFAPQLQERFLNPDMTLQELDELVAEYSDAANKDIASSQGWPQMTYFTSKAALNSMTRILAREKPHLLINCCCPGWVATDLGSQAGSPPKTPDEGARIPLHLAFGDVDGVSGRYWANDSVAGKGEGRVQPF